MARHTFESDYAWSERYSDAVHELIQANICLFASVNRPTIKDDQEHGVDLRVSMDDVTLGVRTRDAAKPYRDVTFRAKKDSGSLTELDKIRDGECADIYLYAWGDERGEIEEYVFLDMLKLGRSGLIWKYRSKIPAGDGNWFVSFDLDELRDAGIILAEQVRETVQGAE